MKPTQSVSPLGPNNTVFINATKIRVTPEKRKELYQTIMPLLDPIRQEKGCLNCNFYLDAGNQYESLLVAEWESKDDLDNHLQSNHFAILVGAICVLANPGSPESKVLCTIELKQ